MNEIPNICIRQATAKDAKLIAIISRTTFHDSFAAQNTKENMDKFMNEQFTEENLKAEVGAPGNTFFIASADKVAAGYIKLREAKKPKVLRRIDCIEIARIYALKHHIGKGIGSALMQTAIDVAKGKNKTVLWLGVWRFNQLAIDFYTQWGFKKFGEHDFLLGDDLQTDWLMKKELYN